MCIRDSTTVRSELVILLRPVVVGADSDWQQFAQQPLDHAMALDPKSSPEAH